MSGEAARQDRPADTATVSIPTQRTSGSEWRLVTRAQAGDSDAFGELYTLYADRVRRYVLRRIGSTNYALAEDIAADTWVRALRSLPTVTDRGVSYGAWLMTVAHNLVTDYFKSGRYRLEVAIGDLWVVDRADLPERQTQAVAVAHITSIEVMCAMRRLSDVQREVIVLRFLRGFSVAETAHAMGRNEGAVKALTARAVRALRRRLLPDMTP